MIPITKTLAIIIVKSDYEVKNNTSKKVEVEGFVEHKPKFKEECRKSSIATFHFNNALSKNR